MKLHYIATTASIAIAIFSAGFIAHMFVLSKSNLRPEKLQDIIANQKLETQALRKSISDEAKRSEISLKIQKIDTAKIATLEQEQSELQQKFTLYQDQTEIKLANFKKLEIFLMYHVDPATYEDITAMKKYITAIETKLLPPHLIELRKLDSYQKLKALLKKLPHQGI